MMRPLKGKKDKRCHSDSANGRNVYTRNEQQGGQEEQNTGEKEVNFFLLIFIEKNHSLLSIYVAEKLLQMSSIHEFLVASFLFLLYIL